MNAGKKDWLVSQEELDGLATVRQIQQKVWQLHQRHNAVRLRDREIASDNKAAQQRRAKAERRRREALLPPPKEHVRQA